MKIINLTPHVISLQTSIGIVGIQPSGVEARVSKQSIPIRKMLTCELDGQSFDIQTYAVGYSSVTGLPSIDFDLDAVYIVSGMVKQQVPMRDDVLSPEDLIRDAQGVVRGCRGLIAILN
jgi:hypothetical protein